MTVVTLPTICFVILGGVAIVIMAFIAGGWGTHEILTAIIKRAKGPPTRYYDSLEEVQPSRAWIESNIVTLAWIGGGLAALLAGVGAFAIFVAEPKVSWIGFLIVGLLVLPIISVWLNSGNRPVQQQQPSSSDSPPRPIFGRRPKQQPRTSTHEYQTPRGQRSTSQQESSALRSTYQDHLRRTQAKQAEVEAVTIALHSLFLPGNDPGPKLAQQLEEILNRLFVVSDISLTSAFESAVPANMEGDAWITSAIDIDKQSYLVELHWRDQVLDVGDVSPHLVRIYSGNHLGGMLIARNGFTPVAIAVCTSALSEKVVALCELQEIVMLAEQDYNLQDFLKAKFDAAAVEKNPLFKPFQ